MSCCAQKITAQKSPPNRRGALNQAASAFPVHPLCCIVIPGATRVVMRCHRMTKYYSISPAKVKERLPLSTAPAFRHCALISQSALRDRLAPCGAVATEPVSHTSCCTHCQCARVGVSRVSHRVLCLACCLTSSNALQGLPAHPPCARWRGQAFPGPGFQDGSGTLDNLHQHWLERPAAAHTHHTQQDSSSEPLSALAFRKAASLRLPRPGNPLSLIPLLHFGSLI